MTLTTRLTAFSLGALAVVLLGFSSALYVLARTYLHGQAEERLTATLNTLVAAAEVESNGIEWDPQERHLSVRPESISGPVEWSVSDGRGRRVDGSPSAGDGPLAAPLPEQSSGQLAAEVPWQGRQWLMAQRRVEAAHLGVLPPPEDSRFPKGKYAALVVTAAVPLGPMQTTLANLALALSGTSLGLWLLAALVGRSLCRRALSPLTRMAATARSLNAATLDQRLPQSESSDEVSELGRSFNELLARLQESFERQRRFTGDASHQLRTPLTAMLGQVEVALRRERPPEEYRRALASVQRQGLHMRQIVEMLLFLSRAEAEARLPDPEVIDLTDWLKQYLQSWPGHPREVDFQVTGEGTQRLRIEAHAQLLGQLLGNLLDNACKYSAPGTLVRLRLGNERGTVWLAVEDEGTGITPEDLPHVFEPFYRSTQARRQGVGGVGLGLAVAERIATAFGGSLAVASTVGKGTTVTLRLPQIDPGKTGPNSVHGVERE